MLRLLATLTNQCLRCWGGSRDPASNILYDEAASGRQQIPLQEVAFPPEGIAYLEHQHGDSSVSRTTVAPDFLDGLYQWYPRAPLETPSSHRCTTVASCGKLDDPEGAADTFSRFQHEADYRTLAAGPAILQATESSDERQSPLPVQSMLELTRLQGSESPQATVAPSDRAIRPEAPHPAQGHPGSQHDDASVDNCGGRTGTIAEQGWMDNQDAASTLSLRDEDAVVYEEPPSGALPCDRREATAARKRLAGNIATQGDDGKAAPATEARAAAAASKQRCKRARRSFSKHGVVSSPAVAFGESLLREGLLRRVDSEGRHDGSWVMDTSIYALLQCLSEAAPHTYRSEEYDVGLLHLDCCSRQLLNCSGLTEAPTRNQVMVVAHINAKAQHGLHYSLLIINARQWVAHVFDTLTPWPDKAAASLVKSAFPCMEGASCLRVHNHTGELRQSGATCGAWTAWLAVAYAFNFGGCRHDEDDDRLGIGPLQDDAPGFWNSVTY